MPISQSAKLAASYILHQIAIKAVRKAVMMLAALQMAQKMVVVIHSAFVKPAKCLPSV